MNTGARVRPDVLPGGDPCHDLPRQRGEEDIARPDERVQQWLRRGRSDAGGRAARGDVPDGEGLGDLAGIDHQQVVDLALALGPEVQVGHLTTALTKPWPGTTPGAVPDR
ncbi:hypothetical protein Sxan_28880 [Streptomyces xanthophaeus]|uniref:Uncharacterized protein n=1 Tax=Streptomyces xanthophaeus TaxID=67385 RepID=A0A919H177_9ACTN|nr:hypothetical protein Sxan_28880 [Streptomyces xanthophaeus]